MFLFESLYFYGGFWNGRTLQRVVKPYSMIQIVGFFKEVYED
jgi:hypothetical protein